MSSNIFETLQHIKELETQKILPKLPGYWWELVDHVLQQPAKTFCVTHHYSFGDQRIYLERTGNIDPKRAAIYCQFKCEEWFGSDCFLSNLGIGTLLVHFYDCEHCGAVVECSEIDMYFDREKMCGEKDYSDLMNDSSLHRSKNEMKMIMLPHISCDDDNTRVVEEAKQIAIWLQGKGNDEVTERGNIK